MSNDKCVYMPGRQLLAMWARAGTTAHTGVVHGLPGKRQNLLPFFKKQ
jgi:hypothetical protein